MISLGDMRPARRRSAGAQQRRLPVRQERLAEIIDLAKNLDDPIQHHRLHHSAMAAYLKRLFSHNPLIARKPLIRVTYIPLAKGFIYLVAIMDWHSRAVLAWRLSNTLHADFCVDALEEALRRFGRPEIFNTDQGSQFTSTDVTGVLKASGPAWTA